MDALSTRDVSETVELKGHLIDSLTLSKVIDRIQHLGGDYRLNDIRIGTLKKDISSVNITLFADNRQKLQEVLDELSHYGAMPASQVNVEVMPCPADGELPAEAFAIKLPGSILYEGRPIELGAGDCLGIAVYPDQGQARLLKESELKKGTLVISGTQGIEW